MILILKVSRESTGTGQILAIEGSDPTGLVAVLHIGY